MYVLGLLRLLESMPILMLLYPIVIALSTRYYLPTFVGNAYVSAVHDRYSSIYAARVRKRITLALLVK